MEWKMFFMPVNVTYLHNTDYNFRDPQLKAANQEFLEALKFTEAGLESKGIPNFIPLNQISRSIQY
jgi:hypothetical protein